MSPSNQPAEAIKRQDELPEEGRPSVATNDVEAAAEAEQSTPSNGDVTKPGNGRQPSLTNLDSPENMNDSQETDEVEGISEPQKFQAPTEDIQAAEGRRRLSQAAVRAVRQVDPVDLIEAGLMPKSSIQRIVEDEKPFSHDAMESSTATLKPETERPSRTPKPEKLALDDPTYLDPTPKTPLTSQPPSRSTSSAASIPHYSRAEGGERSPTRSDAGFDEKAGASEDEREASSRSEIQTIMDQFSEEGQGPGHEEVMSPRLEFAGPLLGGPIQHPPRKSSLEPLNAQAASAVQSMQDLRISSNSSLNRQSRDQSDVGPAVPPKPDSIRSFGKPRNQDDRYQSADAPMSPPPLHRPPPPEPEPEPDLPFDFHRFLEQLRHRTADPVAKFLRSFLQEFGKKQWMVHEQVKIISDFLAFITNKMAQCDVWREVSDAEFDNAREGMEKLVMNRLYTQTFSPAIPPPQPIPGPKPRRKGAERPMGPGRRGQHQEDVERDDILAQKVSIYGWIKEEHLDIPAVGGSGKRFLLLAQQGVSITCPVGILG
jgi:hypothetical protein